MIRVVYGPRFLKSVRALPKAQQKKLASLLVVLSRNPLDPRLHAKRLSGELAGFHSFRITRDWRVLYQFVDPTTIQLILAAHRREVYS